MAIRRLFGIGIGALLIVILAACIRRQESDVPVQQLSVPPGNYGAVLRFPSGEILLAASRDPSYESHMARFYVMNEERFVDVPLPDDSRCRRTEYTSSTALPDGKLGLNMICDGRWPDQPIGRDGARYIVAYNWETGEIEQIVAEPLPYESLSFSWNPEMTRGVQGIGSLLGTIYWITPAGMEPMTITIGTGEQSWSLDENLVAMYDDRLDNTDVGIARNPVWSPDGRFIAFWASTNVIGRSGISRARGAYSLYLLDPDTLQLQQILDNVRNTSSLVWSPDSQWLLFTGDIVASTDSLWLISIDGDTLQLVGKGANFDFYSGFNGWNWLNNQEIIATRCLDSNCDQTEAIKYDISQIVGAVQE